MNGNSMPIESVKILYKYLPQKYALKVIKEKRLKLSIIDGLNDVFDCNPVVPDRDGEGILGRASRLQGMLCFSKGKDCHSPLLWGHYADSARGLALGFDREVIGKIISGAGFEVRYQDDDGRSRRQKIDWRPELFVQNDENRAEQRNYLRYHVIPKTFGYKSSDWLYEEEYRFVAELETMTPCAGLFFFPFPEEALREVVVGVRSNYNKSQRRENRLRGYLKRKYPRQDIVIKFLKEHESECRFEIDASRTIHTNPCCGDQII